jgi:hypothetical protein
MRGKAAAGEQASGEAAAVEHESGEASAAEHAPGRPPPTSKHRPVEPPPRRTCRGWEVVASKHTSGEASNANERIETCVRGRGVCCLALGGRQ